MKKKILISVLVLVLALSGASIYYFGFYRVEVAKKAALAQELAELENWYQESKKDYYESYRQAWEAECQAQDLAPGARCIPTEAAAALDEKYTAAMEKLEQEYLDKKEQLYELYE